MNELKTKLIFLYKIHNKAGSTISFTCNTEQAERQSKNGCTVNGYAIPDNHTIRRKR